MLNYTRMCKKTPIPVPSKNHENLRLSWQFVELAVELRIKNEFTDVMFKYKCQQLGNTQQK